MNRSITAVIEKLESRTHLSAVSPLGAAAAKHSIAQAIHAALPASFTVK